MKLRFHINRDQLRGTLTVKKEDTDPKARASGYTRQVHGWGAEVNLLHLMLQELNKFGFNLCRRKMGKDGHMYGDDHMCYLRTPKKALRKSNMTYPYMYIYDGNYAIQSSAEKYNKGEYVYFLIEGNVFTDGVIWTGGHQQPDWHDKVETLCQEHNIHFTRG